MLRSPDDASPCPWRLPASVRAAIKRQRDRLLTHAVGHVVLLDPSAAAGADPGAEEAPPTSVLGVLALAAAADPAAVLTAAAGQIRGGGRLLLLEPYRRVGWTGHVADASSALLRRSTRLRTNLPVADLVRRAGFVITTVERVTMPTAIVPLRSFCLVVAERRATSRPDAGPSPAFNASSSRPQAVQA